MSIQKILDKVGLLNSERKKYLRKLRSCLGNDDGKYVLSVLEKKYEVHLSCFQGQKGDFDPLDAMRRDAYREVFAGLRRDLGLPETNEEEQPTEEY